MSVATEKQEGRFKDYILPVFGIVIMIIGYFVSEEKAKSDANTKDLYIKWDAERDAKIQKLESESLYWRDRYLNCIEAK